MFSSNVLYYYCFSIWMDQQWLGVKITQGGGGGMGYRVMDGCVCV